MEQRSPVSHWVRAAQQGDTDSFGRLVEAYSGAVLAAAYSRLGDIDVSEDIRQDAFLVGFERLSQLRNPAAFGKWIRIITVNLCHHWQRSQIYRRRLLEATAGSKTEAVAGSDDMADAQTVNDVLQKAMERLSASDREALLLFYFEGQSLSNMAENLGISEPALRKRLQRARERLRDALSGRVEDELRAWAREKDAARKVLLALPAGSAIGRDAAAANALIAGQGGMLGDVLAQVTPVQWAVAGAAAVLVAATATVAALYPTPPTPTDSSTPPAVVATTPPASPPLPSTPPASPAATAPAAPFVTAAATNANIAPSTPEPTGDSYISGLILDENDAPIAGANVEVWRQKPVERRSIPDPDVVATATSDENGLFLISNLEPDLYLVTAHTEGLSRTARSVQLERTEPVRDDVTLYLLPAASLVGTVLDPSGEPVEGADVSVYEIALSLDAYAEDFPRERVPNLSPRYFGAFVHTLTDANGRFQLDDLPRDFPTSDIIARKAGFAPTVYWGNHPPQSWRTADPIGGKPAMERWQDGYALAGGDPITIRMRTGVSVAGAVVEKQSGQPVAEATVVVSTWENGPNNYGWAYHYATAMSDGSGAFHVDDIPAFSTGIYAERDGLMSPGQRFELNTASSPAPITLALALPARIEGIVIDSSTEQPIENARVSASEDGTFNRFVTATTDSRGRFTLAGLPPAQIGMHISVQGNTYELDRSRNTSIQYERVFVDLEPGETRRDFAIYLVQREEDRRPPLEVYVVDSDGHPVPRATIYYDLLNFQSVTADGDGAYTFQRLLNEGTYAAVHPDTGAIGTAVVDYRVGAPLPPLTIVTDIPSGRITGRVDIAGQAQLPGGLWVEFRQAMNIRPRAAVNGDGTFLSPPLPEGAYEVRIESLRGNNGDVDSGDGAGPATWESRTVTVVAGETTDAGTFTGTVMDQRIAGVVRRPGGDPVPSIAVRIEGDGLYRYTSTDADGHFAFDAVAGGGLVLTVGSPPDANTADAGDWTVVGSVEAGTDDLDITLPPSGRLTGSVSLTEAELEEVLRPGRRLHPINVQIRWMDCIDGRDNMPYSWDVYVWQPEFDIPLPPGTFEIIITVFGSEPGAPNLGFSGFMTAVVDSGAATDLGAVEIKR